MKIIAAIIISLTLTFVAAAQNKIIPILDTEIGSVLGGVAFGKDQRPYYVDAAKAQKFIGASEESFFYSYAPVFDIDTRRKVVSSTPVGNQCDNYFPTLIDPDVKGILIGTDADWRPDIRKPVTLFQKQNGQAWQNKTYEKIAADFLGSRGIENPNVRIVEAKKVDLEGDGTDEVLLNAAYYKSRRDPFVTQVGDYHFVLLRKIIGGKAQNLFIRGDFKVIRESDGPVVDNEIYAILDLNGDGRLEVVIHSAYPEARYAEVYDIDGRNIEMVMSTGCGA
jgi:hypothetical protein